jgi:hypothetical protein
MPIRSYYEVFRMGVPQKKSAFDDPSLLTATQLANRLVAIRNEARKHGPQGSPEYEAELVKQMAAGRVRDFLKHFSDLMSSGRIKSYNAVKVHAEGNAYTTFTRLEHLLKNVVRDDATTFNYVRRQGFLKPFTQFLKGMRGVNPDGDDATLKQDANTMAQIVTNLLSESAKGRLAFASTTIAALDRIASELENKGMVEEAAALDVVSNTLGMHTTQQQQQQQMEGVMEPGDVADTKRIFEKLDVEHGLDTLRDFLNHPLEFLQKKFTDLPKEDPAVMAIAEKISSLRRRSSVSPEIFGWDGIRNFLHAEWPFARKFEASEEPDTHGDVQTQAEGMGTDAQHDGITK